MSFLISCPLYAFYRKEGFFIYRKPDIFALPKPDIITLLLHQNKTLDKWLEEFKIMSGSY